MSFDPYINVIKGEEGFSATAYECTGGALTIGYGCRIDDSGPGISEEAAECDLKLKLQDIEEELVFYLHPVWFSLEPAQHVALISMRYQLGRAGFRGFKKMLAAIRDGDMDLAAQECLDSVAAKETPERYARNAEALRTGKSQWSQLT